MNYSVVVVSPQIPISWSDIVQKNPTMAQAMLNNVSSRCSENNAEVKNTNIFGCNFCKRYFSRDHLLREHLTRCQFQNSDLPSTFCGVCKQIFCGMEKLQRHMQTHFIGDNNVNTTTATNNIKGAARPIVTKVKLTNNNQSYECKFCGRTFQKGSAMKMHIDKVHMTDVKKEFKCRFCNQQYTTRLLLQNHEASHEGKWRHTCLICGKGFNSSGALVIHERIHTSNKPYKCTDCDKRFVASNELRKHQRIHTGERPYKCAQCNSTFTQAANLRRHQLKNCRGRPSLKTIMKNLNKKNANRLTKVEETFDVPEPVAILPLAESDVVPSKKSPEPQVKKVVNIQPSDTLTQINTNLDDFTCELSQEEMLGSLGDDSFNAFGEIKPTLGLEGMDTKPIQLLGLDDLEPQFGNEALHLVCDESNDNQVTPEVPLDGNFDLGTFSPFKKSAGTVMENGHYDSLANGEDETPLLNYLKLEVPFLSQNGLNTKHVLLENGFYKNADEKTSYKEDSADKSPKQGETSSKDVKIGPPTVTTSPLKFKHRSNLHLRGKPIQQWRHNMINPVKKAVKMSIKKSPRRIIRHRKRERVDWQAENNYEVLLDSLDIAKHTINGQDVYPCTNCERTFTELGHIKLHMIKTHQIQETKKFACKYCNKQYSDRSTLKGHENQHNGDNKFTCKICHKVFNLKAGLVIHERVHSGHRPFSCASCDKTFRSSNELARHRRTHTGARPYKCHYCTMTFTQSANLRRHMAKSCKVKRGNLVIDVQPLHSCTVCGASFNDKSKLEQHASTCRDTSTPESVSSQNSHQMEDDAVDAQTANVLPSAVSEQPKDSSDTKTLNIPKHPYTKNSLQDRLINVGRDQKPEKTHIVDSREMSKELLKNDDFETSMKNKLNALNNSIRNKKLEIVPHPVPNGLVTEKPRAHVNGYVVETNKKLEFLSTDDSTIGYENGMGAVIQMVVESKGLSAESKSMGKKNLGVEKGISKPNGFSVGEPMLTSLLNGANLLTGNGVTAGSTPFPRSEPEPKVNGTDHSPAVKRLFPGTNPIIAQWDSLRERSRKYKLARKIKKKSAEPVDLGDKIRVEGEGEDQVHVCTKCDRKFKKRNHVKQHLIQHHKLHLGDKNYECSFCGKQYSDWITLKGHEKQHMGEYYQCRLCSKPFYTKGTLKVHEKTHSSERPYQCKECDKSFKTSRDMNRHTRKHTGIKPYKCTKCGKMFTQSGNLKRHVTNNKCKLQQNERSGETKPNTSPMFKSASISGSRIRRKSYSPARLRKSTPPKRQRKQRTPTKKIPSTNVSPKGDAILFPPNATYINNENLPEMETVSEKATFQETETGETRRDRRDNTESAAYTSVLPLSVKCDNIDLIQEVLDKDDTLHKTVTLQKPQKNTRDFITEENRNPTFNSLNNVELNDERNSSVDISRNSHLNLNSDIHTKNRIEEKIANKKFTCSKCDVVISSRAALTLHYNTKHLNNINNDDTRIEKSQDTTDLTTGGTLALPCPACEEVFPSLTLLRNHQLKHHREQEFRECSSTSSKMIAPDQHVANQHSGDGRFKCEVCSKSYVFKGSLKKHMETCKNIHRKRSQAAKQKKRTNSVKSSSSQSTSGSRPPVTLSPGVRTAQITETTVRKTKLHAAAIKSHTKRPPIQNPTLIGGSGVSASSEGSRKTLEDISREIEPCDTPEEEGDPAEGDPCDVSVSESIVSQNECLEFYEEVPHGHLLPYITPVFATDVDMLSCDPLTEPTSAASVNHDSSQDIEDLDLATSLSGGTRQRAHNGVSEKRTLDGLGIDSRQPGLNARNCHVGRQCTGDGENENGSGAANTVKEQPASSGGTPEQTQGAAPDEKITEEGDTLKDSDIEDPSTEDALQAVVKCRLCTEEFGRLDELALHVCLQHSPVVRLIRLTQADYDAYNVDPENVWNSSTEDDCFVTKTEKENQDEGRDTTDNIRIVAVSGGVSAAETVVMESRGAVATAADATLSTNVKVIEPKDMVQIASTKGAIYIEKSNLPQLGKYEEHVQILPRGDSDVKFKCKFCDKMFMGQGAQGELSAQERIKLHIEAHLTRTQSRKSGPNILKRGNSVTNTAPHISSNQQAVPSAVPVPLAVFTSPPAETSLNESLMTMAQSSNQTESVTTGKEQVEKGYFSGYCMEYMTKNGNTMRCKLCGKIYSESSRHAIKRHLQTMHSIEVPSASLPTATSLPNMWQCKFCSDMFPPGSIQVMECHLMINHADKLDPSSPLWSKNQTMASSIPQVQRVHSETLMTSSVPEVSPTTQSNESDSSTDTLYSVDTVKCKFCGEMFVKASLADLQKHLLSQHGDIIDPNTMVQIKHQKPVDSTRVLIPPNTSLAPEASYENPMPAAGPPVQEQTALSYAVSIPQPAMAGQTSSSANINVPFTPMDQNVTIVTNELEQSPRSNIDPNTLKSLVTRLQEFSPFVEVVHDKFGPGYKCRLCGKTYSSSALSPVRRHLIQFHATAGHTYQGIQIPNNTRAETREAKGESSNRSNNKPSHGNPPSVPSNEMSGEQGTVLNENWADYSKFINLEINETNQVLSCKFCSKSFTTDSCKSLIEHLLTFHLNQNQQLEQLQQQQQQQQQPSQQQPEQHQVQVQQPSEDDIHSETAGSAIFSDEFLQKCCKVVVIGSAEMLKCRHCGVVYNVEKVDKFRDHIFQHYINPNKTYSEVVPLDPVKKEQEKKILAQRLGTFENVEFYRCSDVVEVDNTIVYKCKYCRAVFDKTETDTVRAHLFSHYITTNGYPGDGAEVTSIPVAGATSDVASKQVADAPVTESTSVVQPVEIVPDSQ